MNDIDKVLADVMTEGTDPFADIEKTISTESLPDSKTEDTEDKGTPAAGDVPADENIPFHKHPRWIERENELNAVKEREETLAREIEELKQARTPTDVTIPQWFSELYGDNAVAWQKYSENERTRTEEIESRVLSRLQEEEVKKVQEIQKWDSWVDSQFTKLETNGYKFDRTELTKILLDMSPTDADNNLDFEKGYKIYAAMQGKPDTAKSEARKQLADTTSTTTTRGEPAKKDYMTSSELRNRSWGSLSN